MAAPPDRLRLKVLLGAALVAMFGWFSIPGSALDKLAFRVVIRGFNNPPFFIGGFGSRQTPWNLRTFSATAEPDERQSPLVVSLGDDPEGVFQSSPPSPVDLAVVFSNIHRLGARKAASAAVLAWDQPDAIGLAALDKVISRFDSVVSCAPLARGAVPQAMPAEFRRASIAANAVAGDVAGFPRVNRVPLGGVILGGEKALAGFQFIETEPAGRHPLLVARWDDRVVLAFPLLVVMQRLNVPVDALEIRPGSFIRLGRRGPIVPIDHQGRMIAPFTRLRPFAQVAAEDLIDGGPELFPPAAPEPVVLRDDRGAAERATRGFSAGLAGTIAAIASDSPMWVTRGYPRPGAGRELALLAACAALLAGIAGLPPWPRRIGFALTATGLVISQWIACAALDSWLPGPVALAMAVGAAAICALRRLQRAAPLPAAAAPTIPVAVVEQPRAVPEDTPASLADTARLLVPDPPATVPVTTFEMQQPAVETGTAPRPAPEPRTTRKKTAAATATSETAATKTAKPRTRKAPTPAEVEPAPSARKAAKKASARKSAAKTLEDGISDSETPEGKTPESETATRRKSARKTPAETPVEKKTAEKRAPKSATRRRKTTED